MNSNSQHLLNLITKQIATSPQKRITFAEFMDLVLYHPHYGYYSSGTVQIGSQGDFFTSSSLGADFGELLGKQFIEIWEILGQPAFFSLVEMGAGQGVLAADVFNYLQHHVPQLLKKLSYIIIEQAPGLVGRQQELLQPWLDKGVDIAWKTWQEIPENSLVGCCFSNELVDAFPVHQVVWQEGKLQEVYLTSLENKLVEIIAAPSTPQLTDYFTQLDINFSNKTYADGYRSEVNLAALNWLETLSKRLSKGYLITIDYGYDATKYYHPQRSQGTLQCYYQHRRHNNPYLNLGYQDITSHVNFTALEFLGELFGLQKVGLTQQGMFLMALGLGERLQALSNGTFNFQEVLQRRDALHQLIDPTGLGGFKVLVQSKGIDAKEVLQGLKEFG
ncbi:MAG: class I SAM-dependent methyltransferase [Spirulinaceae cyanobacterium]